MLNIKLTKTATPKAKPADESKLGFGRIFTDHMFVMTYTADKGWHNPEIVPYGPISLEPSAMVLHYGQEIFEGTKAYRAPDGSIRLFRLEKNYERMILSCERMCIPPIPVEDAVCATNELLKVEADWVPQSGEASLYIRPFIIATEGALGVHAANEYKFYIILSPVGAYYAAGFNPVDIYVETHYVRAVRGGIGFAKTGGNYAASLLAQSKAKEQGYSQVLWLDGVEQKYVEEVGAMNVMFRIGDEIVTPSLGGSTLAGVTRMSCLELFRSWGVTATERRISIDELYACYERGELKEAFCVGTAAVISPIGKLKWGDKVMDIAKGKPGEMTEKIYKALTDIQWGRAEGPEGWSQAVK